ncbi:hypothetical protein BC938DRAFT_480110 [Jimgerdemannia flammicorona]|uniref:Uncharacterized protein n=1 Tax=Jimgerdemannia flammicorona TaxID=994334 RepID=A0A433QXJ8_9FUNG|nr:hypothetical protein BC938DRAFT_480110 [Jimgerdemannia flammicorona]
MRFSSLLWPSSLVPSEGSSMLSSEDLSPSEAVVSSTTTSCSTPWKIRLIQPVVEVCFGIPERDRRLQILNWSDV